MLRYSRVDSFVAFNFEAERRACTLRKPVELRDSGETFDLVTDGDFDADDFAVQVAAYVMSIMGLLVALLAWCSMRVYIM